jgi:hypothetical protein
MVDLPKNTILKNLCYTELVYGRINKKLKTAYTNEQIEDLMRKVISETPDRDILKTGKNFYITNPEQGIRVTVNSYTFRIITADRIG